METSAGRPPSGRLGPGALLVGALLLLGAPGAGAEEAAEGPTRDQYRAAVEPICKATASRIEPKLRGVKRLVLRNTRASLRAAGRRILSTSRTRAAGLKLLERVPRPPADAARLSRWFKLLRRAHVLLVRIGKLYFVGNRSQPFALENRHRRIEGVANRIVLPLGFRECRAESARFR